MFKNTHRYVFLLRPQAICTLMHNVSYVWVYGRVPMFNEYKFHVSMDNLTSRKRPPSNAARQTARVTLDFMKASAALIQTQTQRKSNLCKYLKQRHLSQLQHLVVLQRYPATPTPKLSLPCPSVPQSCAIHSSGSVRLHQPPQDAASYTRVEN